MLICFNVCNIRKNMALGCFVSVDVLSLWTFCPAGRFVFRMFCLRGRFVPEDVLSHWTFCPKDVLSIVRFVSGRFVPLDVLSQDVLSTYRGKTYLDLEYVEDDKEGIPGWMWVRRCIFPRLRPWRHIWHTPHLVSSIPRTLNLALNKAKDFITKAKNERGGSSHCIKKTKKY
jgi:hypothetical protein